MAGITVPLYADVKSYLTGMAKAETATDEVAGALDDLATEATRAGKSAGADVATGIDKGTDKATDSVERLERTFRDLADGVSKSTKRAGDDLGDNVTRGTHEAEAGLDEFGDEAAGTARETAASFDGSAESIADAFQEIAANAFAGFGPAGAAAGLAVALGLGVGISKLQEAADKANALTEEAAGFAVSMRDTETGADRVALLRDRWDEVATKIADARQVWEVWQPRAVTNIERFADAARESGFDVQGLFDAFDNPDPVARLEDLNRVFKDTQRLLAQTTDEMENYQLGSDDQAAADARALEALREKRDALIDSSDAIREEIEASQAAADITEALALAAGQTVEQYKAAQVETERLAAVQDSYTAALGASGDAVGVYEDILSTKTEEMRATAQAHADETKEATGQAADSWEDYATDVTVSTDELIAEWNRQAEAATAFETNLAIIAANGGQALADELRAKGPEVAGAVADTIAKSDPSQQHAAIQAHARATGQQMSDAMGSGMVDHAYQVQAAANAVAAGLTPPTIAVKLAVDTGNWDAVKRRLMTEPLTVPVGLARSGTVVQ